MRILSGHRRFVQSIAFSPDGRYLASGSGDRTVRLWNLVEGKAERTWEDHSVMANKVAFAPDGRWLAALCQQQVRVYEPQGTTKHILGPDNKPGWPEALAFSPDGKRFVAGGSDNAWRPWRAFDAKTWKEVSTPVSAGRIDHVTNLRFAPDGAKLAVIGYEEVVVLGWPKGDVRAEWDVSMVGTGQAHDMPLAFSPDSGRLVYGRGPLLRVRDLASGDVVAEPRLEKKFFQDAAFSPDGHWLATVSNEETVKLWDTVTWKVAKTFAWEIGKLKCVAFAPDGMRAAAGGDKGKIVIWDVDA